MRLDLKQGDEKINMLNFKILDLTTGHFAFSSRLLADLGAFVIRIEKGNPSIDPLYVYRNLNKYIIPLDLKKKEQKAFLSNIITEIDLIFEGPDFFWDKVLNQTIINQNQRLIRIRFVTLKKRSSINDYIISAFTGQISLIKTNEGMPMFLPYGLNYYLTSLYGTIAALLALRKRNKENKGFSVEICLEECTISSFEDALIRYTNESKSFSKSSALIFNVTCKDGHLVIPLFTHHLDTILEWIKEDGFFVPDRDSENFISENLIKTIKEWASHYITEELFEKAQAMRFPWAPILRLDQVWKNSHLKKRKFFVKVNFDSEKITIPFMPYRFSGFKRKAKFYGFYSSKEFLNIFKNIKGEPKTAVEMTKNVLPQKDLILSGIRVLDLTRLISGPFATRILADFGAEVIKVQSKITATGMENPENFFFPYFNRNKKLITLNLNTLEGKELFLKLVKISDIVIENFSPRVMDNFGLSYHYLKKHNPKLIMVSISAFGKGGPWENFVGLSPTFHALSGLMYLVDSGLKQFPTINFAYADIIIGLYATIATLVAIYMRDIFNKGIYIDLSGYEAVISLLGDCFFSARINRENPLKWCLQCSDGKFLVISTFNKNKLYKFFLKEKSRLSNRSKDLDNFLQKLAAKIPSKKLEEKLKRKGINVSIVRDIMEVLEDKYLNRKRLFIKNGQNLILASPLRHLKGNLTPSISRLRLGEHNEYVFCELLGLKKEEFLEYIKKGVIC